MRKVVRTAVLGLVLGLVALVVPDSTRAPVDFTLVKVEKAEAVDVDPDVVWILAVGSDARPGEDPLRTRGDALQLIGLNSRTGAATAIGIPRDSWVPIPGVGSNRVNAALFFGGPNLLGRTVGNLVGIQPDYVMVATFSGLANLIRGIGGITVNNPRAFSDSSLHPQGWAAGRIKINGMKAVEFARVRKSLPGGDFDRSANQQRVLRGIQRKVAAKAARPGFIEAGVLSVLKNLHTRGVSAPELFRLAQAVAQVDPAKVRTCVLPGSIGNVGGASVVLPNTAVAKRYGREARKDATLKRC
ncbi:LCP family protein [Nocardioides sp. zg-536]|uniref:LCP family protein n=2 Tax=Nocardioides faecalis TaxID=2803858 RepID=A0A939BU30_9ACTN|nr:LCP family protein [Nocardioides faecalis]MBS4752435.1 LCP family protein [Nocardioides faecalis]QVI60632.1 LCP family protein [Nocardioides faecalis]